MNMKWERAMLVVSVAALVRLVFAGIIPLFPDETYYWEWSRHLAAGYFDHPPAIAILIRLGTTLLAPFGLGATPLAVRLAPALAGIGGTIAMAATARRVGGDAAAFRAAL